MSFETNFRLISYLTVFCGFLSLWVSRTFGPIETCLFIGIMVTAWLLEDSQVADIGADRYGIDRRGFAGVLRFGPVPVF
jgi:hypothetical protein